MLERERNNSVFVSQTKPGRSWRSSSETVKATNCDSWTWSARGKNLLISSWLGLSIRPRVKLSVAPAMVFKFIEMALYCKLFLVKCENSKCGWYNI